MDSFVLGAQLLLAVVFATAGIAKLLDQPGSRTALEGFGVPERVVPVAGWLLPLAELATAGALIANPTAQWGAVAALVLLLAFIGGIANALSRGQAPDCHCFGQLHSAPAGRGTVARNAVLAGLAAVVLVHGAGPPIDDWIAARTDFELVAVGGGLVAAVLAAFSVQLWLDNRGLRRDLEREREAASVFPPGLPVGAWAPAFELPDVRGETCSLDQLLQSGRPAALVFVSPGCGPCAGLLPDLSRWQAALADRLTIGLLSTGSAQDNERAAELGLDHVLLQDDETALMDAYRLSATPSAVVVGPDGRIASAAAVGAAGIEPLIRVSLRSVRSLPVADRAATNGARSDQSPLQLWHSA